MKRSRIWPAAIFGLIGLNVVIVGITIYYATNDPSGAVEPQYYQKALAWDDTARLRDASARLGWRATAGIENGTRLVVRLSDGTGAALEDADVNVTALAVARASDRQELKLSPSAPGEYGSRITLHRGGIWQFRVEARRGPDRFSCTLEQELTGEMKPVAAAAQEPSAPAEGRGAP